MVGQITADIPSLEGRPGAQQREARHSQASWAPESATLSFVLDYGAVIALLLVAMGLYFNVIHVPWRARNDFLA